jgi:single-stranded-DNA-specific exonuclease
MAKKWIFPPDRAEQTEKLARALGISPVTAGVLVNRGCADPVAAQQFLQPTLHGLRDPCGDEHLTAAARLLLDAARDGRKITVFGDYDADGITGAAVLLRCFAFLGGEAELYIPHRVDEGYGLSCDAVRELAEGGTQVMVTVDCGVTATEEVALAHELGMELVITDHHEPNGELPDTPHILNPKLPGRGFGYRYLAGVGVAFKLAWALGQEISEGDRVSDSFKDLLMEMLSLVAVGTIADMVPLVDENRVLARYGLRTLASASSPGLRALLASSRLGSSGRVSARDVAFRVAPRLNAAGRMGDARAAVEMLTTDDQAHAVDLAEHLDAQNRLRMKVQREALQAAEEMLEADPELREKPVIVLAAGDWHQGVLGLVASRLAETHWRPAFVLGIDGETVSGSGRSVPGIPLFHIVRECADLLDRFGGHEGAAGLTLPHANLPAFTKRICGLASEFAGAAEPVPELSLDGDVSLRALTVDLLREVEMLEPFGKGNPQPLFAASGLVLVGNPRIVGTNRNHLAFMVRQGRTTLRAIGMGKADWFEELTGRKGEPFSLAFEPSINTYQGRTSVELRAEDLQWDDDRLVERGAS